MSRSLLRVNYEYSSKFKRGAVRDWHPHRAQVAFGSNSEVRARKWEVRFAPKIGNRPGRWECRFRAKARSCDLTGRLVGQSKQQPLSFLRDPSRTLLFLCCCTDAPLLHGETDRGQFTPCSTEERPDGIKYDKLVADLAAHLVPSVVFRRRYGG